MKKFMTKFYIAVGYIFLCLSLPVQAKTPEGIMYDAQILRVSDGDTIVIAAPFLPKPLKPELAVRIYGVDTPEKGFRAKCPQEDERGKQATKFTTAAVAKSSKRQVVLYDRDKFGGRVLGDIICDPLKSACGR